MFFIFEMANNHMGDVSHGKRIIDEFSKLAKKYNYSPFVIECQNTFENVHEVPKKTIDAMRTRWETIKI